MITLALLEDEADLREELQAFLVSKGYEVIPAGTRSEFVGVCADRRIDVAVIDRGLPDGDGLDAAGWLRQRWPDAGVIVLTARGGIDDKVDGLTRSADHYLVKPVRLSELAAHIASLLRRVRPGGWRLSSVECCLYAPNNARFKLTAREYTFWERVANAEGGVVSRRDLVEAFDEDWLQFDLRRLDTLVSRMRKRCRDECAGQILPLRTEHSRGYFASETIRLA